MLFRYSKTFRVGIDGRITRLLNPTEYIGHVVIELLSIVLCRLQACLLEPGIDLTLPKLVISVNVGLASPDRFPHIDRLFIVRLDLLDQKLLHEPPRLVRREALLVVRHEHLKELVIANLQMLRARKECLDHITTLSGVRWTVRFSCRLDFDAGSCGFALSHSQEREI